LHLAKPSLSVDLRWSPLISVGLRRSPLISVGLRWSLLISVGLRWSPLVSVDLRRSPLISVGLRRSSVGLRWSPLLSVAHHGSIGVYSEPRSWCRASSAQWKTKHHKCGPQSTKRPEEQSAAAAAAEVTAGEVQCAAAATRWCCELSDTGAHTETQVRLSGSVVLSNNRRKRLSWRNNDVKRKKDVKI